MTSLRSTYAAGDHPHATCVTFFSFRLSPPFPPPFSLSFSLLLPSSSLCPPLCEYSSSSSSSSSYFTSLVLFFLYLCPRTQSLALFLSLSVGSSPFADLRVDQTLQMDTLFLSGATCRTWFPPFLQERSRVSVSCVSQRHPRSKETR